MGIRGFVSNKGWNMLYIRPAVNYSFSSMLRMTVGERILIANFTSLAVEKVITDLKTQLLG